MQKLLLKENRYLLRFIENTIHQLKTWMHVNVRKENGRIYVETKDFDYDEEAALQNLWYSQSIVLL